MSALSLVERRRVAAVELAVAAPEWTLVESPVIEQPSLTTFYESVLPKDGFFCVTLLPGGQHLWAQSHDELASITEQQGGRGGVYFGTAAFRTAANRKQSNVAALKSLRLDIDAGAAKYSKGPAGTYETRSDAIAAVLKAVSVGLPRPTWVISSGEGLHLYWTLAEAAAVSQWEEAASALAGACERIGLIVDSTVTEDSARILRPLGTMHKNGARVTALRCPEDVGVAYEMRSLLAFLVELLPTSPSPARHYDSAINADVLASSSFLDRRDRDVGLIAHGCGLIGDLKDGTAQSEGDWRPALAILKYCAKGEAFAHEWSAHDARYTRLETQRKLDGWNVGPPLCGSAPRCTTCSNQGKLKTPLELSDRVVDGPLQANPDSTNIIASAVQAQGLRMLLDVDTRLNLVIPGHTAEGWATRSVAYADSEASTDAMLAAAVEANPAGRAPTERAIELLLSRSRHQARQRGEAVPIFLRTAYLSGAAYVSLRPGRIARIGPGAVDLLDDASDGVPLFRRGAGSGTLPDPAFQGTDSDALRFLIGTLVAHFGMTPQQATLIIVTLLEWHRTNTPHPILEIVGPAGSGKSTLGDCVLTLIDPSKDGQRVTVGTGAPDIAAAAQQRFVLAIDNAGRLDKATSDFLCLLSTGGTLHVRMLYTNSETAALRLHRPLMVTAVSPVCVAADLQSRVVRIELSSRQGSFEAEAQLRERWDATRAKVLGALYILLAGSLREVDVVRQRGAWAHRLVDFDQMGEAAMAAAGLAANTFSKIASEMRNGMARRSASGDSFLKALLITLRKLAEASPTHVEQPSLRAVSLLKPALVVLAYDGRIEITARPGALLAKLPVVASYRDGALPTSERAFGDAVRRVAPLLSSMHIRVVELAYGTRNFLRFDFVAGAIHED
jgi:hypothetical protein